jgi:tRNA uridine 5-carboxymethylaminomethyl modification enzyme
VKHFDFDIIVIGGGHAGVEAALAASRMEKSVGLITMDKWKLSLMSCNPAIGGLGKSHIVKEVDALGGVMGKAIDAAGIQFRRLNLSRGPAVWSTRAQADRINYNRFVCDYIASDKNIQIIEATAGEIVCSEGKAVGVITECEKRFSCRAVIICSGTFLGGLIHIGEKQIPSGRRGEKAAYKLTESLKRLGLEMGRLKTGTPPRLDGNSIDYAVCVPQYGENPIPFFSYTTVPYDIKQATCHLTYTTDKTKEIILANLHRAPLFSGQIKSRGPRYCPSIEDKIFRFSDKPRHQIFLEPEGNGTSEIYPNGFATSLPEDVQEAAIRSIVGLENVVITQYGYAIEYDYCPAHQVKASLETKRIENLYLAGQIIGTSGYEEAAGLGIMAGINAALKLDKKEPFILDRGESYIGVMIDDLITHSTTEPYRMFTSRAEYRLALREDNARDRLFKYAEKYKLIPSGHNKDFENIREKTEYCISLMKKRSVPTSRLDGLSRFFAKREAVSIADLIKIPGISYRDIFKYLEDYDIIEDSIFERAAIRIKYEGYIKKQEREIAKFRKMENEKIPDDFRYENLGGLRNEAKEKFSRYRPESLGQASRIEGITIGDLAALSIHVKKHKSIYNK